MPAVITATDRRLSDSFTAHVPDAGGMIIILGSHHGPRLARLLTTMTAKSHGRGSPTTPDRRRIGNLQGTSWLVRGHAEGVDVPAPVGVYATNASTPLFAQAIGRFVRSHRRVKPRHLRAVGAHLLQLASALRCSSGRVLGRPHRKSA